MENALPDSAYDWHSLTCGKCGIGFCLTTDHYQRLRANHDLSFWCPNGHERHFIDETPDQRRAREATARAERAERERDEATRARAWAERQAKGANIARGLERAKRLRLQHRVECGVCPKCHRTFKQLAAHMKTKHSA